jgi:type III restriction enzyme
MIAKYALLNKLHTKIIEARFKAKAESFMLFQREYRKTLDFENGFEFKAGMYDNELYYQGKFAFKKHFLGNNKIPLIDGGEGGEEFKCAQDIDAESDVKFWLRNVARHHASFRLPTSTDNFYPDFIAQLNDGRILVVEYKGAHLADTQDTKEKALIGAIWEKVSNGKGLFMVAVKSKDGSSVAEQIKAKILLAGL